MNVEMQEFRERQDSHQESKVIKTDCGSYLFECVYPENPYQRVRVILSQEELEKAIMANSRLSSGDYVLATEWFDGDPDDQWCVGFYDKESGGRHYVVDGDGRQFRMNGFRRVKRITAKRGKFILDNITYIDCLCGNSLWWWSKCRMSNG